MNTQQNPESLLNHLLTNIADQIAELWEFGENVYYSQYPSSAEGTSLDNAAQLGGTVRESAAKSYYKIHCTGEDGMTLEAGTILASDTNPAIQLTITEEKEISRASCSIAVIRVPSGAYEAGETYYVIIGTRTYSVTAGESDTEADVLGALASAIDGDEFTAEVDEENLLLTLTAADVSANYEIILSDNLTTETVTSILTFGTVDTGDIYIPNGVITKIVKADARLLEVVNKCGYIAGQDAETDTELRKSYIDKIFNRSSMMLESIKSAILNNVQGVESIALYENPTDETDDYGRPPHSIEVVVEGGDSTEIAQQILRYKAAGINTYGYDGYCVTVVLPGEYEEDITIYFSRPETVYVWYYVTVTVGGDESFPSSTYGDLIREVIVENMDGRGAGEDVIPQTFVSEIHEACPGVTYFDIRLYGTTDSAYEPDAEEYTERYISISARQRAVTTESMITIEVVV